ncbi:MAG: VWA domain-containing protein [Tepidisphaeraceae bacterium]
MSVESPVLAGLAVLVGGVLVWLAVCGGRRAWRFLLAVGATLLLLAGAGVHAMWRTPATIVALVDVSPSTRGASYRSIDALRERLRTLAGSTNIRVIRFASGLLEGNDDALQDVPTDRTSVILPDADAVLLFSDGRADITRSRAHVFPVIDPELEKAGDGRVTAIERVGDRVIATVHAATTRQLSEPSRTIDAGDAVVEFVTPADQAARVALARGDRWPENDTLTLGPMVGRATQRWWLGANAPAGWQARASPPVDRSEWLGVSVVVLNDVSTASLDLPTQQALATYVRDLGGGLVIVGGPHTLSAGGYAGTPLDALSPLSSTPPMPQRRWIILVDASGSMAEATDGRSRLSTALDAALAAGRSVPRADRIDLATFARDMHWLTRSASPDALTVPTDMPASGPTNLRAALESILSEPQGEVPTELILLTDGNAELGDVAALRRQLDNRHINVRLLALAPIADDSTIRQVASSVETSTEPSLWSADAVRLTSTSALQPMIEGKAWLPSLGVTIRGWNRVWLRTDATELARSRDDVLAATWRVGTGRVTTLAFEASSGLVEKQADDVRATPTDPTLSVRWSADTVVVHATDTAGKPQNGLTLSAHVDDRVIELMQTAPGEYRGTFPRAPAPRIGRLLRTDALVDVGTIEARYAEEFDAIGIDRSTLTALARDTGGEVVEPNRSTPLSIVRPTRSVDASLTLGVSGLALLGAGLVAWRLR